MNWEPLRDHLCALPQEGPDGFEGLVSRLLSLTVDEPFRLAGKGLQSGGDASADSGGVLIQAKRYRETTGLDHAQIIGDVSRALAEHAGMELYVLAAPRSIPNQLRAKLNQEEAQTGLDIVTLGLGDADPDLGVLCVHHWDALERTTFFSAAPPSLLASLRQQHAEGSCSASYQSLQNCITQRWHTWERFLTLSEKHLANRCGTPGGGAGVRHAYPISLTDSIQRESVVQAVAEWWAKPSAGVAVLEGEEGTGKSWGAAQAVTSLQRFSQTPVIWLDSLDWTGRDGMEPTLSRAIEKLLYATPQCRAKLLLKMLHRFGRPVLVVLDGANERNGEDTVDNLLHEFCSMPEYAQHVRLLFTSRPLQQAQHMWRGCTRIRVDGFNDAELAAALSQIHGPKIADLRDDLLGVLRLPRYFASCVRLLDRFKSIAGVTKELVLWEDLKTKIEAWDPQVRDRIGIKAVAQADEILRLFAEAASESYASGLGTRVSRDLLDECFGQKYGDTVQDLRELRFADTADSRGISLSSSHVTLGWALYLHAVRLDLCGESTGACADRLRKELEPIPSEDSRTEAIFAALQMSVADSTVPAEWLPRWQAALLSVWYGSHNAAIHPTRIHFWSQNNVNSYLCFVEHLYIDVNVSRSEEMVISPLVEQWCAQSDAQGALREALRRWLLLTWAHDQEHGRSTLVHEGHELPVALTENQLRLSSVAISIISHRPDISMLPALALSAATEVVSKHLAQDNEFPAKHLYKNFTILMRWAYTEAILPSLENFAKAAEHDPLLLKGYRFLVAYLGTVAPPSILRLPPGKEWRFERSESTVEALRATGSLFRGSKGEHKGWYIESDLLAVRTDLPALTRDASDQVRAVFAALCADFARPNTNWRTQFDMQIQAAIPWAAREGPASFRAGMQTMLKRALETDQPYGFLHRFCRTRVVDSPEAEAQLLSSAYEMAAKLVPEITGRRSDAFHRLCLLTEIVLLNTSEEHFVDWARWIADHPQAHYVMHLYPICAALWESRPKSLGQLSRDQAITTGNIWLRCHDASAARDLAYWGCLWGYAGGFENGDYEWTCRLLRDAMLPEEVCGEVYRLAARASPERFARDIVGDSGLAERLSRQHLRSVLIHVPDIALHVPPDTPFDQLVGLFQIDYAGWVLSQRGKSDDFQRWGSEVMRVACALVASESPEVQNRLGTEFRLTSDGRIEMFCPGSMPRRESIHCSGANAWGIDTGDPQALKASLSGADDSLFENEQAAWRDDYDRLKHWDGFPMHTFEASESLRRWARSKTDAFKAAARQYIDTIAENPSGGTHLSFFTNTVISILIELDPGMAAQMLEDDRRYPMASVYDQYRVESLASELWTDHGKQDGQYHDLRRSHLMECDTDEALMQVVVASFAGGTTDQLRDFVRAFLDDERSSIRNLAVSLLPWFADEWAIGLLSELKANDPNRWVREHASWAYEVAQQERSCRVSYKAMLQSGGLTTVAVDLHVMEPALLPPCRWWRREIEKELDFANRCNDSRVKALIVAFWSHWNSLSSHQRDIKAFGRKLTEWCRGQQKDAFVSPRMAPWWRA